ncbi:MAG TPA: FAD-binding oxidoreductase [Candidatus Acidoferrum sp.]|nr:FAD-binding oxidoreductase [Candidatus Acidoferrum sp.]
MPTTLPDLEHEFRAILAPDSIRSATEADAVSGIQPRLVLEPNDQQQLAAVLRLANEANLTIVPRGGGSKLSWGNPPSRADMILSTTRLNKVVEHVWADLTVSVEAGCTFQNLQSALAQHSQRLALDPLWPDTATIGGVLSTNDSGSLRMRFGPLRDLIIGVTVALPDGTLASSGGKVVKNVAGYDLPKLVTGALGTLGVITRAVFRVHPLQRNTRTLSVSFAELEKMQRFLLAVQDSQLAHSALQARIAKEVEPVLDILFEGTEAGIDAQEAQLRAIARPVNVFENPSTVWAASQDLWNSRDSAALAKFSTLPAAIARTMEAVRRTATSCEARWKLAIQATGIGMLRLEAQPENLHACLSELRHDLESAGGSFVIHHRPASMPPLDAWGQPGDALPLMRAVKKQLDPRNTLNPGRFVGGI